MPHYVSSAPNNFRAPLGLSVFNSKYALVPEETWLQRSQAVVDDVCGTAGGKLHPLMSKEDRRDLVHFMHQFIFLPGGRYIYYGGRGAKFYNNCYLFKSKEDTREEWGRLLQVSSDALMSGGGIGNDYTVFRERYALLRRTGGTASGPIPLAMSVNEHGRNVKQGGSRRSAIYGSLNHMHGDINEWLRVKDWANTFIPGTNVTYAQAKAANFDAQAPLDFTNISVNYDNAWLAQLVAGLEFPDEPDDLEDLVYDDAVWRTITENTQLPAVFRENVAMAMRNGEPGFSFNFFAKEAETARNAPVSADTFVLTNAGYQQVRDIVDISTTVWTGKQWAEEVIFKRTKEMVPTVLVEMTGGRSIKADPEHEFFVERWTGKGTRRKLTSIEKVPAADLVPGDILHVSYPECVQPGDLADYFRGYIYGDGSFGRSCADVSFCTASAMAMAEENLPLVKECRSWKADGRGYIRAYFNTSFIGANPSKDVCPVGVSAEWMAGLFDANGSYDAKQARIRLASVRYSFLEGVRRELETMGIMSNIVNGGPSGFGGRSGYLLVIAASYVSAFVERIPTKLLHPAVYEPYRRSTIKVVSISPGPIEDVFCCDVGVDEHSFMAEGVIISNCTEVTSSDDSDVCNLGSVNMAACPDIATFKRAVELGSKFLVCGTMRADMPNETIRKTREKNRRLGLGLMGVHEWLLQRQYGYEFNDELRSWMEIYRDESERAGKEHCDRFFLNHPAAYRAIAPTGTIGTMAGTTTGIEPIYAIAYKRRYIDGNRATGAETRKFQYYIDQGAQDLVNIYGIDPDKIECAITLAQNPERRIKFQAEMQDFVDMAISSTLNLPAWNTEFNNPDLVDRFARIIAMYAPRLRGLTMYPDGSRGGQPLVPVSYGEAAESLGIVFEENSDNACKSGVCGI